MVRSDREDSNPSAYRTSLQPRYWIDRRCRLSSPPSKGEALYKALTKLTARKNGAEDQ